MRLSFIATHIALAVSAVHAASVPNNALSRLEAHAVSPRAENILAPENSLEKRKGGGGRGGSGGGGSSSSGSGGKTNPGGAPGRTSPTGNTGGKTSKGSGPPRTYGGTGGGGGYYAGGASTPYKSGTNTPRGFAPGLVLGGAALLLIMPGIWWASVYPYHFPSPYRFYNQSMQNETFPNGTNMSLPVTCLCQEYQVCGCDENDLKAYIADLVGNGSYAALNKTLVTVSDVNGTQTLVLNGSLPNGTTASGGSDEDSAAVALTIGKYGGYWVAGLIVFYTCALM